MAYVMEAYDNALKHILENGFRKKNRTGMDTIAVWCIESRYRIDEHLPIVTGRKVWPKAVWAELLWLLSGSTRNRDLQELGANFWTPWVDEEWAKKNGYVEDAFGPLYGFQLRHQGGHYANGDPTHPRYGEGGADQLAYMMDTLKNSPDSRRNLFSYWSLKDLPKMKLPPCHYTFQLYVEEDRLSGALCQRSCDFPVGVPANIQFYSTLIYMLAQQAGLKPHEFVHSTRDSHIYVDQIDAVEEYLDRPKPDSPKLELEPAEDIFSYRPNHFELKDYEPLEKIDIPVAV